VHKVLQLQRQIEFGICKEKRKLAKQSLGLASNTMGQSTILSSKSVMGDTNRTYQPRIERKLISQMSQKFHS